MELEFNWPRSFWENYAFICRCNYNINNLGWKVNLELWNLFIAIVSLILTYQERIMTLASLVFKKSTFQNISNLNALGNKFDLEVK